MSTNALGGSPGDTPQAVDLPAGDLTVALRKLAEQSGAEFIYSAEQLKGVHTEGVHGNYTAQKAATKLLEGTKLMLTVRRSGALLISDIRLLGRPFSLMPASADNHGLRLASAESTVSVPQRRHSPLHTFWSRFRGAQAPGAGGSGSASPDAKRPAIEEVIVTATRREEHVREVPISISAFSRKQMDVQGMRAVDDIARLSPGVQFTRGGGFGSDLGNSISIRGISSGSGSATTGIYIDDTPVQISGTLASGNFVTNAYPQLFDIERVEVLRGPQGTLFGSGSEGGTVRFITPAPNLATASSYVRSEVSYTEYGEPSYEAGVAGGIPLIEGKLALRMSAWSRRDGGYVDRIDYYTGDVISENNNHTNSTSMRLALAWAPTDQLTITPSVYYQKIKANGSSAFYLPSDGVTGPLTEGGPDLPAFQQPWGDVGRGNYVDIHQAPQWGQQELLLPALKVEYDFGGIELLSNTSYYDRTQYEHTDYTFLHNGNFSGRYFPNPEWEAIGHEKQGSYYFTQELRLQSSDAGARFKWLVGAFYSRTHTFGNLTTENPNLGDMIMGGPFANGCATPEQCVLQRFKQPLIDGRYSFKTNNTIVDEQKAVFGQADFRIVGGLTATFGLRYAQLDNEFANASGGAAAGVPFPLIKSGSADATATTPKYMLSYKSAGGDLFYASATKGFRGGGSIPPVAAVACQPSLAQLGLSEFPLAYGPDSVWSYEIGSKFALADGRLQVDVSVFDIEWQDQIRTVQLPTCLYSFIGNVGSTQSRGFDLAVQWRALDSLLLSLNGGYQSVKAKQTIPSGTQNLVTEGDHLRGSQPTGNAAAQYTFDLGQRASYLRLDLSYTGKARRDTSFNPLNTDYDPYQLFEDPSFTTANLRLGTQLGDWDVSLFINNLTNEQPILGKDRGYIGFFGVPSALLSATTLRPRTAGLTAVLRF